MVEPGGVAVILDRLLGAIGLKRKARYYQGAEISRLTSDWFGFLATPDAELQGELRTLRGRSRDLCRNNAHAAALKRAWVDNIAGPDGTQHFPLVQNARGELHDRVNNTIREWWNDYSDVGNCTVDGHYSRADLERLVTGCEFEDGEFLALKIKGDQGGRHGYALQLLDPEQLDVSYTLPKGPNGYPIRMGVEINAGNRPRGYWLYDHTPGDIVTFSRERMFVPAERVFHYFEPRRPGQTRGFPRLASVMYGLKMLDGYEEAEVMAARVAALAALLFMQDPDHELESISGKVQGSVPLKWEPGMSRLLPPGVEPKMMAAEHPTTAFEPFTRAIQRRIAAGPGVAYHTMTGDLSQSNYVSMRGGDLQQRDVYRGQQSRLIGHFTKPFYRDALASSLLFGTLNLPNPNPDTYGAVRFKGRGWSWTDPKVDLEAAEKGLALGVTTRSAIASEQGDHLEDLYRQRQQDEALEESYGLKFIDPLPSGVTQSLVPDGTEVTPDDTGKEPANAAAD